MDRRAASAKDGYVRESIRQGIKPAYWGTKAARAPEPAFAYAKATGSKATTKRDTLKAVRSEFDARMTGVEDTLGDVIAAVSKTHEAVDALSTRISDRMAA